MRSKHHVVNITLCCTEAARHGPRACDIRAVAVQLTPSIHQHYITSCHPLQVRSYAEALVG